MVVFCASTYSIEELNQQGRDQFTWYGKIKFMAIKII